MRCSDETFTLNPAHTVIHFHFVEPRPKIQKDRNVERHTVVDLKKKRRRKSMKMAVEKTYFKKRE